MVYFIRGGSFALYTEQAFNRKQNRGLRVIDTRGMASQCGKLFSQKSPYQRIDTGDNLFFVMRSYTIKVYVLLQLVHTLR